MTAAENCEDSTSARSCGLYNLLHSRCHQKLLIYT